MLAFVLGMGSMKAIPYSPEYLQTDEPEGGNMQFIRYGNFDQWLVRHIKESGVIGGKTKTLYCIAPNGTGTTTMPTTEQAVRLGPHQT